MYFSIAAYRHISREKKEGKGHNRKDESGNFCMSKFYFDISRLFSRKIAFDFPQFTIDKHSEIPLLGNKMAP